MNKRHERLPQSYQQKNQMNDNNSIYSIIAEIIGDYVIVFLITWGLVSAFALTWGQALMISWMFYLLRSSISVLGK